MKSFRRFTLLFLFIASILGLSHQEDATENYFVFQEQTRETIRDWEKRPGVTPPLPQVNVPPSKKNPKLKGEPGDSPSMGSDTAPIRVYIWSDFQCPNCMRVVEPLKYLVRKYPAQVQVIFKQYPLASHKKALPAAWAAVAASKQGRFWDYQDKLFQNMRRLNKEDLQHYAMELGLDMFQFVQDMESDATKKQVEYEKNFAEALGLTGTPGFAIHGKTQAGWASYEGIEMYVKRSLRQLQEGQTLDKCQVDGFEC